jgi:hypothetical protein
MGLAGYARPNRDAIGWPPFRDCRYQGALTPRLQRSEEIGFCNIGVRFGRCINGLYPDICKRRPAVNKNTKILVFGGQVSV